jgi:hypothetical protein
MFTVVLSYICVFLLGGGIAGWIVATFSIKEAAKLGEAYKNQLVHYKDIANTAIRCASKFENRCRELEVKYGEPHVQ